MPAVHSRSRPLTSPAGGGTAVPGAVGGLPIVPIAIGAVVVLGVIIFIATRGDDEAKPVVPPAPDPVAISTTPNTAGGQTPGNVAPTPAPPDQREQRTAAIGELDRALRAAQLWSTISVDGTAVDLQSGACGDPQMASIVDGALSALRSAGVTTVRCRERHGAIAFTRDL
jgi:hypothetical protein